MTALPAHPIDPTVIDSGQLIAITRAAEHTSGSAAVPLQSRAPHRPWWQRRDVYYDDWVWDRDPLFYARTAITTHTDDTTGAIRTVRTDDPIDIDGTPRTHPGAKTWRTAVRSVHTRRMVAVLDGLGHATTEQLTALVGWHPPKRSRHTGAAWDLGLVRRGRHQAFVQGRLPWMWTLHESPRIHAYAAALGPDAPAVFGGRTTPRIGSRHTRHDILVTEAVTRLLESSDRWVAVGPEHTADPRSLTGDADAPDYFRGDAVLWRNDGLRVVIEVCASRNNDHAARRMTKWATWLSGTRKADSGLVVIMLNASRRRHAGFAADLRKIHSQVLDVGRLRTPSGRLANADEVRHARAQLHLAAWEDWFPAAHTISIAGATATTALTPNGTHWFPIATANPAAYPYTPRSGPHTAPAWLLTPHWVAPAN